MKNKIQEIFDFATATCQAFPIMKDAITTGTTLPQPDYFRGNNSITLLNNQIATYEQNLSTYLFLVSFSYFENYIKNVVNEIISIHNTNIMIKVQVKLLLNNPNLDKYKQKLKGINEPRNLDQYRKFSKELRNSNYLHPRDAFDFTSKAILNNYVKELKAYQIPELLKDFLLIDLPNNFQKDYKSFAEIRNRIAHGNNPPMTFIEVRKANNFFRNSAKNFDKQIVSNFIKPNNYQE